MVRFVLARKDDNQKLAELKARRKLEEEKTNLAIAINDEKEKIRELKAKRREKTKTGFDEIIRFFKRR